MSQLAHPSGISVVVDPTTENPVLLRQALGETIRLKYRREM